VLQSEIRGDLISCLDVLIFLSDLHFFYIERLNKEFKRRTKPMEIVAGENACYTLLAFICLKMELHWRSNPIGKVHKNLPFLKEWENKKFTQKS